MRSVIDVHDDSTAMKPMSVVSRMSSVLMPSTPRKYSAPIDGIHRARSTSWKSGFLGLYQNHSGVESRNPASAIPLASHLMASSFRRGTHMISSAPAVGKKRGV